MRWARWAVERNPYDENGIRRLLARLVEAGDRAGAVLAYEQFAQRLSADLELQPSADTTALVDALRRTAGPFTSGPASAPPPGLPEATRRRRSGTVAGRAPPSEPTSPPPSFAPACCSSA